MSKKVLAKKMSNHLGYLLGVITGFTVSISILILLGSWHVVLVLVIAVIIAALAPMIMES